LAQGNKRTLEGKTVNKSWRSGPLAVISMKVSLMLRGTYFLYLSLTVHVLIACSSEYCNQQEEKERIHTNEAKALFYLRNKDAGGDHTITLTFRNS
jgi:hypothetical protein